MEKLSTIQKRNNLNEVFREGEIGPGGAYHDYSVLMWRSTETGGGSVSSVPIRFQKGARTDPDGTHEVFAG